MSSRALQKIPLSLAAMLFALSLCVYGCSPDDDVYVDKYPITPIPTNTPHPRGPDDDVYVDKYPITPIPTNTPYPRGPVELNTLTCGPGPYVKFTPSNLGLSWSSDGSLIVFSHGNTLYMAVPDKGSTSVIVDTNLRDVSRLGVDVEVSPDGARIAYTSCNYATEGGRLFPDFYADWRDDPTSYNFEIVVSDITGTNRVRLTEDLLMDRLPVWSRDGERIAFISQTGDDSEQHYSDVYWVDGKLFTVAPDGSDLRDMTPDLGADVTMHMAPRWSPDDSHILFGVLEQNSGDDRLTQVIHSVDTETLELRRFPIRNVVGTPAWSPDGSKIAFAVKPFAGVSANKLVLKTSSPDGTGITEIFRTDPVLWVSALEWSPDGTEIMLATSHGLHIVGRDGSNPRVLPHFGVSSRHGWTARWSPDGSRIAVVFSDSGGSASSDYVRTSLFTVAPDGTGKHLLMSRR